MQKQNVQIGKNYVAKIDDALIVAKIEAKHKSGGWIATDVKTNRQLRITTPRKLKREANEAEAKDTAPKSSSAKNNGKKLTAQFAYETWRQNNVFPGLFIFELPENYVMFGRNAELTAGVLKRQKQLVKKQFTFSGKKTSEYVLTLKGPEIFGVMKNLATAGNVALLVTQKKPVNGNGVAEYEISKHILAGRKEIIDGMPPRDMVVKKAGQCTYRVINNPRRKATADIQHIEIKPGETFKSQSGNEYQIQMVSETAVYAQQLRDSKPTGPTRPFDKKSIADGYPKGLRDEDSYYPKSEALEAAEKVLTNTDSPMDAKSIIHEIRKHKLWFTTARTPHTTLAAAISRDIKRNGNFSRFQRIGRGMYQLTNKPATKQPAKIEKSKKPAKPAAAKTIKAKTVRKPAQKAVKKVVKKATPKATKKTSKMKK